MLTGKMDKMILFDGLCNLCNDSVQFIIKHDKLGVFKFASLQSESGKALLRKYNLLSSNIDSIVFIRDNRYYLKSTAVIYILKDLRGGWGLLFGFIVIPRFIRDFFYDLIAKTRYKLFGKKESCMLPDEKVKERFLDDYQ